MRVFGVSPAKAAYDEAKRLESEGRPQEALAAYEQARRAYMSEGTREMVSSIHYFMACIFATQLGNMPAARFHAEQSIRFAADDYDKESGQRLLNEINRLMKP